MHPQLAVDLLAESHRLQAVVSPDQRYLLLLGLAGGAHLYTREDGSLRGVFQTQPHDQNWTFSPCGRWLAVLRADRLVRFDLATGSSQESDLCPYPLVPFALGDSPHQLWHAAYPNYLIEVDPTTWRRRWSRLIGGGRARRLGLQPGARLALVEGEAGTFAVELPSGRRLEGVRSTANPIPQPWSCQWTWRGHTRQVRPLTPVVALARSAERLVVAYAGGWLFVWERDRRRARIMSVDDCGLTSLAVAGDAPRALVLTGGGRVCCLDLESGQTVSQFSVPHPGELRLEAGAGAACLVGEGRVHLYRCDSSGRWSGCGEPLAGLDADFEGDGSGLVTAGPSGLQRYELEGGGHRQLTTAPAERVAVNPVDGRLGWAGGGLLGTADRLGQGLHQQSTGGIRQLAWDEAGEHLLAHRSDDPAQVRLALDGAELAGYSDGSTEIRRGTEEGDRLWSCAYGAWVIWSGAELRATPKCQNHLGYWRGSRFEPLEAAACRSDPAELLGHRLPGLSESW